MKERTGSGLTDAFGYDSAAVVGVDDPIEVLQGMHDLQHGAHPADGVINCHRADELCRQVGVEHQLHLHRSGNS